MLRQGFSGVFVRGFSLSGTQKRDVDVSTKAVNVDTAISLINDTKPTDVNNAFEEAGQDSGFSAQPAVEADPCLTSTLGHLLKVPDQNHLEASAKNPDIVQSGFFAHFVCKRDGDKFAYLDEKDPNNDEALDGKLGVQCDNGMFRAPSKWPSKDDCKKVETCIPANFRKPDLVETRFKDEPFTDNDEVIKGEDYYYKCQDPNAILSNGARESFFRVICGENGAFGAPLDESATNLDYNFTFPVCRTQCRDFTVGSSLMKAKDSDKELDIRAGDSVEFHCDEHHHIKQELFNVTSINSTCKPDGSFETALQLDKSCVKVPCTDEDIKKILEQVKVFKTRSKGPIAVGKSILFLCQDPSKVPKNGEPWIEATCLHGGNFSKPNWPEEPMCVSTCANFPKVKDMYPTSTLPVLAGNTVEYKCSNKKYIPDTGQKYEIECLSDGFFKVYQVVGFVAKKFNSLTFLFRGKEIIPTITQNAQ